MVSVCGRCLELPHVLNCGLGQARARTLYNTFAPTNPLFVSVDFFYGHQAVTS